jgi:hypothetical protein
MRRHLEFPSARNPWDTDKGAVLEAVREHVDRVVCNGYRFGELPGRPNRGLVRTASNDQ